jgi:antitoxin MazE
MQVRIARWGNSLAVRLPKGIAEDLGLTEGQPVDIAVDNGAVSLRPRRGQVRLSELIAEARRLGPAARPEIVDWGPDVGAEIIEDAYSKPRKRARRAKRR